MHDTAPPAHATPDATDGGLDAAWLWLVLALCVALRAIGLYELDGDVPNSDELWRMNVVTRGLAGIVETPFHETWARYIGLGPWGYLALLVPTGGIDANPWLLRGLSFAVGIAIVGCAGRLLPRRLPREAALGTLLLLAAHPGLVESSQQIKENAWMAALAGAAAYAALRWVETGAARYPAFAAAALSLAATMHPVVLLTGGSLLLAAALLQERPWRALPWIATLIPIGVLLLIPIAHHALYSDRPAEVVYLKDAIPPVWERVLAFLPDALRKVLLPDVPSSIAYFLGALPLIAWGGWRARAQPLVRLGFATLALSFLVVWAVQLWRPTWVFPRYFTHLVPLLLVTIGAALAALPRRAMALGFAVLLVPYLIVSARLVASPREGQGFRAAAAHLDTVAAPQVLAARSGPHLMFRYYRPAYRHLWLASAAEAPPAEWTTVFHHWPGAVESVEVAALRGAPQLWWLRCDEDDPPPPPGLAATGEWHGCVERVRLTN